jgi:hypothetical protein
MADDPGRLRPQHRIHTNFTEDYATRYSSQNFGVTPEQLKVGNTAKAVDSAQDAGMSIP